MNANAGSIPQSIRRFMHGLRIAFLLRPLCRPPSLSMRPCVPTLVKQSKQTKTSSTHSPPQVTHDSDAATSQRAESACKE